MQAARFLAVSVAGLLLDLAVAWSAARLLGLPLWLAAATGFLVAAVANYALHEMWTFRNGTQQPSAARALRYSAALGVTLGARVASVAVLGMLFGDARALPVFVAGAGVSFGVHYLVSKHFVFLDSTDSEDSAP